MHDVWKNPGGKYGPYLFWSWNGKLSRERLAGQIELFKKAGFAGAFMHSRQGLKPPYLGDEWFNAVSTCIDKADEVGFEACIYDEDKYPSGQAGGLITRNNPEYCLRLLVARKPVALKEHEQRIAAFKIRLNPDGTLLGYDRCDIDCKDEDTLVFDSRFEDLQNRMNYSHAADMSNPDAVDRFIELTHDQYAARFKKSFSHPVSALFTDEPSYGWLSIRNKFRDNSEIAMLHWPANICPAFKDRFGCDLQELLPQIAFPAPSEIFNKVVYNYRKIVFELFLENYTRKISSWCKNNSINMTGHYLGEDIHDQVTTVGSSMRHYEFMDWPGVDVLRDTTEELSTVKQCSSVANQLGKERVLSEMYGCTGWDWPLEGHKFQADWQYACGVNMICQHLGHYTLAGSGKRDYPASISYQSPWFKHYDTISQYLQRLTFKLMQGKPVSDILVIHPVESLWGIYRAHYNRSDLQQKQAKQMSRVSEFVDGLARRLMNENLFWDYGDEDIVFRHGRVEGKSFCVGKMKYKAVVVPALVNILSSTVKMLKEFSAAGGKVLFVGSYPQFVDACRTEDEDFSSWALLIDDAESLVNALDNSDCRRLRITCPEDKGPVVWANQRNLDNGKLLFIQSHDRKTAHKLNINIRGSSPVIHWDLQTGKKTLIKNDICGNKQISFDWIIAQSGSALFSIGLPAEKDVREIKTLPEPQKKIEFASPMQYSLSEPNTIPLDYCSYRLNNGDHSGLMPVRKVDTQIRKALNIPSRQFSIEHGESAQPYYIYTRNDIEIEKNKIELKFTFEIDHIPAKLKLAFEKQQGFNISVNGRIIGKVDGWWVDQDFQTVDISSLIHSGTNEICLTGEMDCKTELEPMYLLGDFAVESIDEQTFTPGRIRLSRLADKLSFGGLIEQGLAFYSGSVIYRLNAADIPNCKRAIIELESLTDSMVVIHVNNKQFVCPWHPFTADITEALQQKDNDIRIEVVLSRGNILGPLHVIESKIENSVNPFDFEPANKKWSKEYMLINHGLLKTALYIAD